MNRNLRIGPISSPPGSLRSVLTEELASEADSLSIRVNVTPSQSSRASSASVTDRARGGRSTVTDFMRECERAEEEAAVLAEKTLQWQRAVSAHVPGSPSGEMAPRQPTTIAGIFLFIR